MILSQRTLQNYVLLIPVLTLLSVYSYLCCCCEVFLGGHCRSDAYTVEKHAITYAGVGVV